MRTETKRTKRCDRRRLITLLILVVTCWAWGTSCDGDGVGLNASGDLAGDLPGTGLEQVQALFDAHCIRCHVAGGIGYLQTGGSSENGLDLTSGNSFGALVGQPTFQDPNTQPRWRVLAAEPDSSYLVQKISSDSPKVGRKMPFDGPPFLSASDIQLIRSWIEEGAPNQ